jgi:hypothetical protein
MAPPVELPITSLIVLPLKNSCELACALPAIKAKRDKKQMNSFIRTPHEIRMKAESETKRRDDVIVEPVGIFDVGFPLSLIRRSRAR